MDSLISAKAEFPPVHAGDGLAATHMSKVRLVSSAVVKVILAVVLMGLSLVLIYQVVQDKQNYDSLLSKYNGIVVQKGGLPDSPVMTLAQRALESSNASLVYTTTTVTKGTTITVETTASTSRRTSASASAEQSTMATGPTECGPGIPRTVTVTVTAGRTQSGPGASSTDTTSASSDASTYAFQSPSSAPATVIETRATTATVFVTVSGLVSPKAVTSTLTATATELQTSTEVATVNPAGANNTSSTSTAEGVFATDTSSTVVALAGTHTAHRTRYPNITATLSPYSTAGHGGVTTSTASYTVTIQPGSANNSGAVSSTGRLTTPFGTTTSRSDPVSTVVTVSGADKTTGVCAGVLFAVAIVVTFHF